MFEEDGIYGNCSTDTSDNNTSCGFQGCNRLRIKLTANFGAHWRTLFFGSLHTHEFDIGELQDLVLLMTLGSPGSAVARLYHLLGQSGHGGRFANHLVCGWRLATSQAFPPEAVAAELLSCVDLLLSSRHGCRCGMELWECPPAILALLRVRLGCRLASGACCTLVCWLGICCSNAADCPGKYVLCDGAVQGNFCDRAVALGHGGAAGMPLFTMQLCRESGWKPTCVSVADNAAARKALPMELTALRAALQRRTWRWLRIKWLCTLTPVQKECKITAEAILPDCAAAAFRNAEVASAWAENASELQGLYGRRSKSVEATAQRVGELMKRMVVLLPHCYCKAVQRVLQQPLVDVNLSTPGFFVYCLLSPFLGKPYVGAVGLEGPRAPYLRLREHLRFAKLWSSKTSKQRYGARTPEFYKALAKAGLGNLLMVFLAACEDKRALAHAEKCYIRLLSPSFNVLGVCGEDALPLAVKRVLGSAYSEDVRLVADALLRKNRPRLPVYVWPELVQKLLEVGDRDRASKLSRQARQICP